MEAILKGDPPEITASVQPSAATVDAIKKLMATSREDRPQTALDAQALLEDVLSQLDGHPSRFSPGKQKTPRRRRRLGSAPGRSSARAQGTPTSLVVAMACVGAVIGGVVASVGRGSETGVELSGAQGRAKPSTSAQAPKPKPRQQPPPTPVPSQKPPPKPVPSQKPPPKPVPVLTVDDSKSPAPDESRPRGPLDRLGVVAPVAETEASPAIALEDEARAATQAPLTTLDFDWGSGGLGQWEFLSEQVEIKNGGLLFKVPSRGAGTFELKTPLQLPVDVSYSVRVTTRGLGRNGVLWTTLGPAPGEGFASFGGATLYRLRGGGSDYLAGRRKPQALFAGRRHKVRIHFGRELTEGWVDDKLLFSHATDAQLGPLRLAFRLERGVGIDLRHLVIEAPIHGAR
jgi:hypothetical protein